MAQRTRPALITFIASINLFVGLLGIAAVAGFAYATFSQFVVLPKEPNYPEPAPIKVGTLPSPPPAIPVAMELRQKEPPQLVRPATLRGQPVGYFRERQRYLVRQVPMYELYSMAYVLLGGVLVLLLTGSGLALFGMRSGGRRLALIYALLAPLIVGGAAVFVYLQVVPELKRWDSARDFTFKQFNEQQPKTGVPVLYACEGVLLLFGVAYPVFLLAALRRPFAPPPAVSSPPAPVPEPPAARLAPLPSAGDMPAFVPPPHHEPPT